MDVLSRISLANKSIIALITLGILLVGAYLIPQLNQEALPPITMPVLSILTHDPGASPDVVIRDVANPLEKSLKGLVGLQSMSSRTGDGLSGITLQYAYGTDMKQVQQDVTARVNGIKSTLPAAANPQIQASDFNSLSMMEIAVTSDEDLSTLANDIQQKVMPDIQNTDGVSKATLNDVPTQIVNIKLDPQKLRQDRITLDQLQAALSANNITLPAGTLYAQNANAPVRVGNTFNSLDEISKVTVGSKKAPAGLQPVKLADIATVTLDVSATNIIARTNRKPSLDISIFKTDSGNTVNISQTIQNDLTTWQKNIGHSAHFYIIGDEANNIHSSIDGLVREGLLGAAFAILVTFVFLYSIRSTLITVISIPLSALIALIALKLQDFSLNIMTLAGLTIAIGRVIDDSIVVLENIHRHLHLGERKYDAVIGGVKEVAGAVTASTLTTVAVFLPLGFAGGFVSVYFKSFSITVAIALLASLLVSLTIIPVLAYWFLKAPASKQISTVLADEHQKQGLFVKGYVPLLSWSIRHRILTILVALLLLLGSGSLITKLPTNLLDTSNQNTFQLTQLLPPASNLQHISDANKKVESVLATFPEIQSYMVTTAAGSHSLSGNGDVENDTLITTDPNIDQANFQRRLQQKLQQIKDSGTINLNGTNAQNNTVQVQVQTPGEQKLNQVDIQVLSVFSSISGITNVQSSLAGAIPLIDVHVDPTRAGAYGLSALQVSEYVCALFGSITATQMTVNNAQLDVDLTLQSPMKTSDDVRNFIILTPTGQTIHLGDVATIAQTLQPPLIAHLNGDRTATISAEVTSKNFGAVSQTVQQKVNGLLLPAGVKVSMGGASQQLSDAFNSLYISLGIAVLLVFIVMVTTLRSLIQPLILLVSIPFAAIGSMLLMYLTGTALGLPAMIGLLMLIGIVVTNAIVLIDRVNQFRAAGYEVQPAVILGSAQRLRPILMTALATIFALLPMAIGLSPSGLFISRPLSIVVIGGLTSSTLLTLLLVPTLYVSIEAIKARLLRPEKSKPLQEASTDDLLPA